MEMRAGGQINSLRRWLLRGALAGVFVLGLLVFCALVTLFSLDDRTSVTRERKPGINSGPAILLPSLGCPKGVLPGDDLQVVVTAANRRSWSEIRGWLTFVNAGHERVLLAFVGAREVDLREIDAPGPWPSWVVRSFPRVAALKFSIPPLATSKQRTLLCDLELELDGVHVVRPNSVFFVPPGRRKSTILVATDIHVARRWQRLQELATRLLPPRRDYPHQSSASDLLAFNPDDAFSSNCFLDSLVDANRNLRRFVQIANDRWKKGELDAVLLTGDLVDYKYSEARDISDGGYRSSEWSLFEDILLGRCGGGERLGVPLFTALGNHDYRLYPYKIQVYGIRHSGIDDEMSSLLLRRSGEWLRFKFRPSDLDAVRIDSGARNSLEYYYEHINPFDFYRVDLPGARLVVLDSGPDFYCQAGNAFSPRWRRFISAVVDEKGGPRSSGPADDQVQFLRSSLRARGEELVNLVILHAPLINPTAMLEPRGGETPLPFHVETEMLDDPDSLSRQIELESKLNERGLDAAGVFKSQLPILQAVGGSDRQTVVLSGHVHWALELGVGKTDHRLYVDRYSERPDLSEVLSDRVLLLQTPALGHIFRDSLRLGTPAYRVLTLAEGRCQTASLLQLAEAPFEDGYDDWSVVRSGSAEVVRFHLRRATRPEENKSWTRVICLFHDRATHISKDSLEAMHISVSPPGPAVLLADRRHPEEGAFLSLVVADGIVPEISLTGRPSGLKIAFLFERFVETGGELRSVGGLRRHHRTLD